MIGLVYCVVMGWLPEEYFDAALSPNSVLDVPQLPGYSLMLSECRYDRWEVRNTGRLNFNLD